MLWSKAGDAGFDSCHQGFCSLSGGRRSGPAHPYTQAASASLVSIGSAWCATGTGCCSVTAWSPSLFLESVPPLGHWSFSRPLPVAEDFASRRLVLLSMYSGSAISGVSKQFSIIRQHCTIVRQHLLEHKFRRLRLHKFAGSVLGSEYQGQPNTKYQWQEQ